MLTKTQKLTEKKLTNTWKEPQEMGVLPSTCNALVVKGYAIKNGTKYKRGRQSE